jgi:hypothetical protein
MDPFTITILIIMSVLASGSGSVAWRRARKRRRERLRAVLMRKFPAPDRYVSVFDVFWDLGASDFALKIMAAQRLIPRDPDDAEAVFDTILDRIEVHGSYSAFIDDVLEAIQEFYEEHRAAGHRRVLPTLEVRGRKLLPGATTSTSLAPVAPAPEVGDDGLPDGHLLDIALDERARSREDHAPGEGALVHFGDAASREVDVDELLRVDLGQMLRSALRGDLWREAERWSQMRGLRDLRGQLDAALTALWRRFDTHARSVPGFTDPLYDLTRRWERETMRLERAESERSWADLPHELVGDLLFEEARILARLLARRARASTDDALGAIRAHASKGDTAMAGYLVYLNHHAFFVGQGDDHLPLVRDVDAAAGKIRAELRALQRQKVV